MTILEYYKTGKKLLSDNVFTNYLPFMSSDDETVLNGIFKYNFGEKELLYEDETEIDEIVKIVLLKYFKEYESIWNSWLYKLPLEYTEIAEKLEKITGNKTLNNKVLMDITENLTTTNNLTNKTTYDTTTSSNGTANTDSTNTTTTTYNTTDTQEGTGKTTNSGTGKSESLKSNKPFDSTEFLETEKQITTTTPGEVVDTTQNNTNKRTGTDDVDVVGSVDTTTQDTTTNTGTDTTESTGTVGNVKTGNTDTTTTGTEENTDNVEGNNKITIIRELLENIEKYKALYINSIYDRIVQNILEMITLRTWNVNYFDT